MGDGGDVRRSKLISLLLRHDPDRGDLEPDPAGWVDVDALLAALHRLGLPTTEADLDEIVRHGSKPRFERLGGRIRARYGHSIEVDPALDPADPPPVLYHGTAAENVGRILAEGISPMVRRMVHLSADMETARTVGSRHGSPVVLVVDAASMASDGRTFHPTGGGPWLTRSVPPEYLRGRS